jgi:NDP-sugar pyrophosphorylase family protein
MKNKISITIGEKTLHDIDSIIDNVYVRNRSQAIEYLVKMSLGERKCAVILAGGRSADLLISSGEYRLTAQIGKTTVVERAVKKLRENGFRQVFIVAQQPVLTKAFEILKDGSQYGVAVQYIEEKEAKGSNASLRLARGRVNSNFLVVFGDLLFDSVNLEELWNDHLRQRGIATLLLSTSNEPSKKGVVSVEGSKVLAFIQKPKKAETYLVFSSIFAASPEIFEHIGNSLEYDLFPALAEKGMLYGHLSSERVRHIHTKEDVLLRPLH